MRRAICVLVALSSVGAFAQKETVVQEPDRVIPLKKQSIHFGEVEVGGVYARPANSYILGKPKPGFSNLIKVRGDFAPELQKSADQL